VYTYTKKAKPTTL